MSDTQDISNPTVSEENEAAETPPTEIPTIETPPPKQKHSEFGSNSSVASLNILNSNTEEDSFVCERKKTPIVQIPTTKQILGQYNWNGESLYGYLKRLLEELISKRPEDVIEYFDQYSREIRFKKSPEDPAVYLLPQGVKLAKMFNKIYKSIFPVGLQFALDEEEMEEEYQEVNIKAVIVSPWDYVNYFEEIGVCLPREELYHITLALRTLAEVEGLAKVRFWGKIFGLSRSYIIAECELTPDEVARRIAKIKAKHIGEGEEEGELEEEFSLVESDDPFAIDSIFKRAQRAVPIDIDGELGEREEEEAEIRRLVYKKLDKYKKPPIPKPVIEKAKPNPPEYPGEGVNKKVYFVCQEAGDEWIPLPDVKPDHIITARKIRKYLKGFLLEEVKSYPPFPGLEQDLLRAQIARITAGTQVSPLGYYQFGTAGEEAEEGETTDDLVVNPDYDPLPLDALLKTEVWVHHAPYILRNGRVTYWTPPQKFEEEMEEEEITKKESGEDKGKPEEEEEVGPPMLTPISDDATMETVQPWTIKNSAQLLPASGVACVRSNLWPGAYALCLGRVVENIYVGWGLKVSIEGFNPTYLPDVLDEYAVTSDIMEQDDPTPEMEEQWREDHRPPSPLEPAGEEMEELEGEED